MADLILATQTDAVLTLTLNRPDKLNAFGGTMREDLAVLLENAAQDETVRAVVITGAGRAFCAGGDVAYMAELLERDAVEEFAGLLGVARRVLRAMREMPKPILAAVNGAAAGAGCNLALACDVRLASEKAIFSQAFAKIGLHPDWGGTYFLPRAVPSNIACEMFFLGEPLTAQRAYQLGLVNQVLATEAFVEGVAKYAARLAAAPPIPVAAAKKAIYASQAATLESMLDYEIATQLKCFRSQDMREGVRAFLEKRAAHFIGQ